MEQYWLYEKRYLFHALKDRENEISIHICPYYMQAMINEVILKIDRRLVIFILLVFPQQN